MNAVAKQQNCPSTQNFSQYFSQRLLLISAFLTLVFMGLFALPAQAHAENENASSVYYYVDFDEEKHFAADFTSVEEALDKVDSLAEENNVRKIAVDLKGDWTLEKRQCIKPPKAKEIEFNLNGHMINRNNVDSDIWSGNGWGEVFYLEDNTSLIINGGDKSTAHEGYLSNIHGNSAFWRLGSGVKSQTIYGGLITGGCCNDKGGAGAISAYGDNVVVQLNDVTLAGNVSDNYLAFYGYGGAVTLYGSYSRLQMNASSIKWNASESFGGGVYVDDTRCAIHLSNGSSIDGNYTKSKGGGIAVKNSTVYIDIDDSSSVSDNYAESDGGGIYLNTLGLEYKYDDQTYVNLSNNSLINGNYSAKSGGGIYATASNFTGIQKTGEREFLVKDNSLISNNTACEKGGGLYIEYDSESLSASECKSYSALTVENNSHISGNKAGDGAALYCKGSAPQTVTLSGSTMSGNATVPNDGDGNGGALYSETYMAMSLKAGSSIDSNFALNNGGAMYVGEDKPFSLVLSGASSLGSNLANNEGGGLFAKGATTLDLTEGSKIEGNTASTGAGISITDEVESCKIASSDSTGEISGNIASGEGKNNGEGAGLLLRKDATLSGLTIQSNLCSGSSSSGAGMFINDCKVGITDCSIVDNETMGSNGGGIEIRSNGEAARAVLGGTVVVSGNKANKRTNEVQRVASDIHLAEKLDASASDIEADKDLLDNRIAESAATPLTTDSRIGLQRWNRDDISKHNVSAQSEKITAPASVFFSDDTRWHVEKTENEVLFLTQGSASYNATICGASDTPTVHSVPCDEEVSYKATDAMFVKDGYKLAYCTVTGLDETTKLEPDADGNISFKMPSNDVELHAVYYPMTSNASLVIADSSESWSVIGQDATLAFAKNVTYTQTDKTTRTFSIDETQTVSERPANVTAVACEDVKDDSGAVIQKKVTYTLEVDPYSDQVAGWYVDKEGTLKTTSKVDIRTSFGNAEVSDATLSLNDEGKLVIKVSAVFDKPVSATHAVAVICKDANDATRVIAGKAVLVEDGDTYTAKAPTESGWSFYKWDEEHMPQGCMVSGDSVIVADTVTDDVMIPCYFQPEVVRMTYALPNLVVGQTFPSELQSLVYTTTVEKNVTAQANEGLSLTWKKADGGEVGKDDVVESGTTYIADIVTTIESSDLYRYAYATTAYGIVNGQRTDLNILDYDQYKVEATYTTKTAPDASYRELISKFPTLYVNKANDCEGKLAEYACFRLNNGETQIASINWDTSTIDPAQKTGNFTVRGTFEYQDKTYGVAQKFVLNVLSGPAIDPSDGVYDQKQEVTLSLDSSWDGIENAKIYYYVQDFNESDEPDHSQFHEYTPGEKITVGDNDSTLIAFAKNGERESESSYAFYFFDEQHSVKVDSGTACSKDGTEISQAFEGSSVIIKADDAPEGMEFDKWVVTKGDAQIAVEESSQSSFKMPSEDVEVKATYRDKTHCTVTFYTNGGTAVSSQSVIQGDCAKEPEKPQKEGYTFVGWYTDEALTTVYDFDTLVTATLTLYAKWQANTYNVEFDSNGGSEVKSQEVACNNTVVKPTDPTREGYTFKGWQLEGNDYNFSTPVTGDITLKAVWEKNDEPAPEPTPEPSPDPVNPDSGDSGNSDGAPCAGDTGNQDVSEGSSSVTNTEKDALANTGDCNALPLSLALVAISVLIVAGAVVVRARVRHQNK